MVRKAFPGCAIGGLRASDYLGRMRIRQRFAVAVSLLTTLTVPSFAQLTPPPVQTWNNPALGLSVRYLAALDKEDADHVSRYERAVFALHPEADPQHLGADPCAPLMLVLGSGLDRADEAPAKGKTAAITPRGTLTLTEVNRACLDKDVVDDTHLGNFIRQTEQLEGMRPLIKTTNAYIQGSTVWWSASAGLLKDARGRRVASAGTTILGSVGVVANGHMLLWSITANDPALFNRLLNVSVCLDHPVCKEGYSPLVGFKLAAHPAANETASR